MKKAAFTLFVLIVLVVGALLVLPSFWDWNGEKDRIAALVKEHSGRDLTIAGDVSLRLLPTPAFSAAAVTLANAEGGSQPAMVQLEELRIRIALLPLLRGNVLVESVTLVKPEVFLEILPDGRANWDFAATPAAAPAPAAGAGSAGEDDDGSAAGRESIRVDSFIIEDGRLRYRDTRSGRDEVVSGVNAELGADSLRGPFAAGGTATYQGVPIEFDIGLDKLVEAGATGISLTLGLPRAEASGSFIGAISRHADLRSLRGRLQLAGPDLAGFLQGLPGGMPSAAALLAQPFAVGAEITASDTEAAAKAVQLTFGPLSFDGEVTAVLGELPDVKVRLSTKTIDLDKLLASLPAEDAQRDAEVSQAAPAPGSPGEAPGGAQPQSGQPAPAGTTAVLPRGFAATLDFTTDAVLYRGQTLRQLQVAARLEGGRLELKKASAQLPGSSDLAVSGTLSEDAQGPRFSGNVTADSDNLRGLLHWLGADPAEVPADRLRRMSLKSRIDVAADQITLRNTELRLDVSTLTGGVAVALRDRPGFGIGLTIDRLNLDAYLPVPEAAPKAAPQPAPQAAPPAGADAGTSPSAAVPPPAGLPLLGTFDANIDLKIGQLTYRGLPFGGLRLDATLQQGGLVVREMSVADFAGSQARFTGSLANVDRSPSFDGSLDVSVAALSRLVKAAGLDGLGQLPLESFALSGAVNGNREELRFDQRLSALNGSLQAAGRADLRPAALGVTASLALDHPDLSVLLGELLRGSSVPAGLGPVAVTGDLTASPSDLRLSGLAGKLAGVDLLGGDLGLSLAGPRPRLTAELTTGAMPLAALAAPAAAAGEQDSKAGGKAAGDGAAAATGAAGRERWSRKAIDVAALRSFDAAIKLRSKTLVVDRLRFDDAELEAVLDAGLLDLKRFTALVYGGGTLSVSGQADARETAAGGLELTAVVAARDVELKALLRDLADSDRFSGPVSLESRLATRGNSEAALVAGLAGDGKVAGTVTVAAKVEEQAGALVLNLLGKKVKEIRGVSDSTAVLFGAFAGAPAKLDGTFVVEKGILRSDDLTLRGRNAVALTGGNVDLPNWQMESRTDLFRDEDPKQAYLTATLRGPLDSPNVGIGGQPFQRREEPAAAPPTGSPDQTPAPEQQPAKPAKPEDILKEGVKSLLKGLGG